MRSTRQLGRLASRVWARLDSFRLLAATAQQKDLVLKDRLISHVCINTQNTWAEFCRAYALSTVLEPVGLGGQVIVLGAPGIRNGSDVVKAAMRRFRNRVYQRGTWERRDEPPWHDPKTLLGTLDELRASNLGDVRSALSLGSAVFDHLPVFRNFYAHRSEHTAIKARRIAYNYGIPRLDHPTQILCRTPPQASQAMILEWIDDIWATVQLLCR